MIKTAIHTIVLTTLAMVWFSSPARAQLVVTAPSETHVRALTAWYDHHVPVRYRVNSRLLIKELNDRQMAAYLNGNEDNLNDASFAPPSHNSDGDDSDVDGVFESDPDRIALRLARTGDLDMFTFAHEYGHYVWFHLLGGEDRRRYEALYRRQRASHHLVTRYAATDLEEGFAEAFSFFASEPPMLARRDPLSYQFLCQWAGRSRTDE
jgi:hypothetical protein